MYVQDLPWQVLCVVGHAVGVRTPFTSSDFCAHSEELISLLLLNIYLTRACA
jgi:hypothetical protein